MLIVKGTAIAVNPVVAPSASVPINFLLVFFNEVSIVLFLGLIIDCDKWVTVPVFSKVIDISFIESGRQWLGCTKVIA